MESEGTKCSGPSVERAQSASVPPKLHMLLQIPKELAGCRRRLVTRAIARLRLHSEKARLSDAEQRGHAPSAGQKGAIGRDRPGKRHFRSIATIGLRRRGRPRASRTLVESVRAQNEGEPEMEPRPCRRD